MGEGLMLGIDVGTTQCKAAAFTLTGHRVGYASTPTPIHQDGPEKAWHRKNGRGPGLRNSAAPGAPPRGGSRRRGGPAPGAGRRRPQPGQPVDASEPPPMDDQASTVCQATSEEERAYQEFYRNLCRDPGRACQGSASLMTRRG
ncbi:hypothetical protein LIP_2198 [Limnochorda pilosa]|uniref:Carbohydrate kinase FGGY N-terminal domain-containing protein n=1 Tax=Limnochorda pilosa TaxID=1555112 RepID=A0A0K2SMI3_LIMPI|nr:hypothetical protein LIP_2198 [Limnochorda pilosa]